MTVLALIAVGLYGLLLLALLAWGVNSAVMVAVHARAGARSVGPDVPRGEEPLVTVQLAVFNEENVVGRLIDAVAELDWPADRLEVQLLDDSTDDTPRVAAPHLERLRSMGIAVDHVRRTDRTGFKAGALQHGLDRATGELLALFDADFVPPPDFLRRAVGRFDDPEVACVQGRWTHLNRDFSWLTRAQALAIDAHFGVEQAAREAAGWLLNFNGTAGLWRRRAIAEAGGWSSDTLTEDLDLSYRVQLRGWRIAFDPTLGCPAELPTALGAFKAQQRRWATGSIQAARKLLPAVWRAPLPFGTKVHATMHLTHYAVHPLMAAVALLSVPGVLLPGAVLGPAVAWVLLALFAATTVGPAILHAYSQRVLGNPPLHLRDLAALSLLGIGIAPSNARAVFAAFGRTVGTFVRTPKLGAVGRTEGPSRAYRLPLDGLQGVEGLLALYCAATAAALAWHGLWAVAPFILLHAAGFATVAAWARAEARG